LLNEKLEIKFNHNQIQKMVLKEADLKDENLIQ